MSILSSFRTILEITTRQEYLYRVRLRRVTSRARFERHFDRKSPYYD